MGLHAFTTEEAYRRFILKTEKKNVMTLGLRTPNKNPLLNKGLFELGQLYKTARVIFEAMWAEKLTGLITVNML